MSKLFGLIGLGFLALVGAFDWWVWFNLLTSGFVECSGHMGALIGFTLLAIISIPATIFGFITGLSIMVAD
jgi:hypothetical protein